MILMVYMFVCHLMHILGSIFMAHIVKLVPNDFKSVPWKNNRGFTKELVIDPPNASVSGVFCWRLSMASVIESAPFSNLVGIDRTILILDGNGIELDHGSNGKSLLKTILSPVTFQGEWDTYGKLLNGPCVDFNVMTERKRVSHIVSVIYPKLGSLFLPKADTVLVFCVKGSAYAVCSDVVIKAGELLRADLQQADSVINLDVTVNNTILIIVLLTFMIDVY